MMILFNGLLVEMPDFSEKRFENGFSIYEVIRIFKGRPLFLKDNLLRLDNSIKKSNFDIDLLNLNLANKINRFITLTNITEGNVKYILHLTDNNIDEYLFSSPSKYPSSIDYVQGIATISLNAVRKDPEIKYIDSSLRALTNKLIEENKVYEVVLIDNANHITEGSRSNIFFIKNRTFYTAPASSVLSGTSRKRVLDICKEHHLELKEEIIPYTYADTFEAAFLTGTSPLILPISRLDNISFDVNNKELLKLMNLYFSMLE